MFARALWPLFDLLCVSLLRLRSAILLEPQVLFCPVIVYLARPPVARCSLIPGCLGRAPVRVQSQTQSTSTTVDWHSRRRRSGRKQKLGTAATEKPIFSEARIRSDGVLNHRQHRKHKQQHRHLEHKAGLPGAHCVDPKNSQIWLRPVIAVAPTATATAKGSSSSGNRSTSTRAGSNTLGCLIGNPCCVHRAQ